MENKERVLAYSKAKVMEPKQLEDVSGGVNWCHRETVKASGGSGNGLDAFLDVTVDF
mgnify:CR=1 FL=1